MTPNRKSNTLDRSGEVHVAAHIWAKRKQPWLTLPQDTPTWEEGAALSELRQALAPR